jgi:hypothetical protein
MTAGAGRGEDVIERAMTAEAGRGEDMIEYER